MAVIKTGKKLPLITVTNTITNKELKGKRLKPGNIQFEVNGGMELEVKWH